MTHIENRSIAPKTYTLEGSFFHRSSTNNGERKWNPRKICHLRTSLAETSFIDTKKLSPISPKELVDLSRKLNPHKTKEIFFDVSEQLPTKDKQNQFLQECQKLEQTFTLDTPEQKKGKVYLLSQRNVSVQPPSTQTMSALFTNPTLIGTITSFLPTNEVL